MAKEIILNLKINDTDSAKTLDSLQAELKAVNKELGNTAIASESFSELSKKSNDLSQKISNLKNAFKASNAELLTQAKINKDSISWQTAEEGSIKKLEAAQRILVERRKNLNLETELGQKKLEAYTKSIASNQEKLNMYNEAIGRFQGSVGNYKLATENVTIAVDGNTAVINENTTALNTNVNTIEGLENRVKELQQAINGTDMGSEEFKKLQNELVTTDSKLRTIKKSVEGLDTEAVAGEMGKFAGGLSAAFAGVAALSGGANEELDAFIKRVGTFMVVGQGLKGGIEAITASTKLWNIVLKQNPIILIITAVAALAAGIAYLTRNTEENTKAVKEDTESYKNYLTVITDITTQLENERISYAESTDAVEAYRLKKEKLKEDGEAEIETLKTNNKTRIDELNKLLKAEEEGTDKYYEISAEITQIKGQESSLITKIKEKTNLKLKQLDNNELQRQADQAVARYESQKAYEEKLSQLILSYKNLNRATGIELFKLENSDIINFYKIKKQILEKEYNNEKELKKQQVKDELSSLRESDNAKLTQLTIAETAKLGVIENTINTLRTSVNKLYDERGYDQDEREMNMRIARMEDLNEQIEGLQDTRSIIEADYDKQRQAVGVNYSNKELELTKLQKDALTDIDTKYLLNKNNLYKEQNKEQLNQIKDYKQQQEQLQIDVLDNDEAKTIANFVFKNKLRQQELDDKIKLIQEENKLITESSKELSEDEKKVLENNLQLVKEIEDLKARYSIQTAKDVAEYKKKIAQEENDRLYKLYEDKENLIDNLDRKRVGGLYKNLDNNIAIIEDNYKKQSELAWSYWEEGIIDYKEYLEIIRKLGIDKNTEILQTQLETISKISETVGQVLSDSIDAGLEASQARADAQIAILEKNAEKEIEMNNKKNEMIQASDLYSAEEKEKYQDLINKENEKKQKELEQKKYDSEKRMWEQEKQASLVQAGMDSASAMINIMATTKPASAIPLLMALAATQAVAQIGIISSSSYPAPTFEKGGMINGPSHAGGGVMINAQGGEAVLTKEAVNRYAPVLSALNTSVGGNAIGGMGNGSISLNKADLDYLGSIINNKKVYNIATDTQDVFQKVNNIEANARW